MIVVWLPPNAMGLSAVCDCRISRSYSLTILSALLVPILGIRIRKVLVRLQRPLGFLLYPLYHLVYCNVILRKSWFLLNSVLLVLFLLFNW